MYFEENISLDIKCCTIADMCLISFYQQWLATCKISLPEHMPIFPHQWLTAINQNIHTWLLTTIEFPDITMITYIRQSRQKYFDSIDTVSKATRSKQLGTNTEQSVQLLGLPYLAEQSYWWWWFKQKKTTSASSNNKFVENKLFNTLLLNKYIFHYITLHIKKVYSTIFHTLSWYLWGINAVLELSLNIYNIF